MVKKETADIKENSILKLDSELLSVLLKDMSSKKNIIWATDNYSENGKGYQKTDKITVFSVTGKNGSIIKPRVEKSKTEQQIRIRDKAEVFTPSWICNKQNNLIDEQWFGKVNVFNSENEKTWKTNKNKIEFPAKDGKTWQDYVVSVRLEITCGEAPYLASRYDTVTGELIPVKDRIGILDRKLRVVNENTEIESEWKLWAKKAMQSTYGFDWQGDNVLLARENLLYTYIDNYELKFNKKPEKEELRNIAEILAWNIWQMDGLKYVIPESCHNEKIVERLLWGEEIHEESCEGCRKNNPKKHNGIYCYIMDWEKGKKVKFVDLFKEKK